MLEQGGVLSRPVLRKKYALRLPEGPVGVDEVIHCCELFDLCGLTQSFDLI